MDLCLTKVEPPISVIRSASKFFQQLIVLLLGFGIGFELPIVVFYLVIFNIVPLAKLRSPVAHRVRNSGGIGRDLVTAKRYRQYLELVLLTEASMLFARITLRKRIEAQKKAEIELR